MKENLNRYLKKILLLSGISAVLMLAAFLLIPQHMSPAMPFVLAFFMGASIASFLLLQKKSGDTTKFVNGFMTHSVVRILLYLAIILTYAMLNRGDAVRFIIGFFVLYLIYTFFEVFQFLSLTRRRNNTGE